MISGRVLVLGGARSGKSAYAERLVEASGLPPVYVATAEAGDAEMAARIREHRDRRGPRWRTVEAPRDLERRLAEEAGEGRAVLVDCLTLWLSNALLDQDASGTAGEVPCRSRALAEVVGGLKGLVVLVSNEVGMGLVPEYPLGRAFRDAQGRLNQMMAQACSHVVFVAAGLPLALKGECPR